MAGRGNKLIIGNDLDPEYDQLANGKFYAKERAPQPAQPAIIKKLVRKTNPSMVTKKTLPSKSEIVVVRPAIPAKPGTHVIYEAWNQVENKSYIGKTSSYEGHGTGPESKPPSRYGSKGRFRRHWSNSHNKDSPAYNECPIFYEALRNSKPVDWLVFTHKVCGAGHLKENEEKMIKKCKTSDPALGYNYFVGDKKPDHPIHLKKFQNAKAISNASRSQDGSLKRKAHSKHIPANINRRSKGYLVQITIDKIPYRRFYSWDNTKDAATIKKMKKIALKLAISKLAKFKIFAANKRKKISGSKTSKK